MNIESAFPSNYLKASDLHGQDLNVTIKSVVIDDVGTDNKPEPKPIVMFHEVEKGLVLNVTNKNVIVGLLGPETDRWSGQKITLFPTQVDFRGDQVEAIRVRLRQPQGGKAPTAAPLPSGAVDAMRNAWRSYQDANKGEAAEVIAAGWKALVAAWFPGKPKEIISGREWQSLIDNKFAMPPTMADVLSGAPQFKEDEIPF